MLALTALFAAASDVGLFVQGQWALGVLTTLLTAIAIGGYVVSQGPPHPHSPGAWFFARRATAILVCVPLGTVTLFYLADFATRIGEDGPIVAIARFAGPVLPAPYFDCRPSDKLADALCDVGHRYSHLTA